MRSSHSLRSVSVSMPFSSYSVKYSESTAPVSPSRSCSAARSSFSSDARTAAGERRFAERIRLRGLNHGGSRQGKHVFYAQLPYPCNFITLRTRNSTIRVKIYSRVSDKQREAVPRRARALFFPCRERRGGRQFIPGMRRDLGARMDGARFSPARGALAAHERLPRRHRVAARNERFALKDADLRNDAGARRRHVCGLPGIGDLRLFHCGAHLHTRRASPGRLPRAS